MHWESIFSTEVCVFITAKFILLCWFHSLTATEILDFFYKTDWVLMIYATFGQI